MHWHNNHLFLARMAFLEVHQFRAVSRPVVSVCLTVNAFLKVCFLCSAEGRCTFFILVLP